MKLEAGSWLKLRYNIFRVVARSTSLDFSHNIRCAPSCKVDSSLKTSTSSSISNQIKFALITSMRGTEMVHTCHKFAQSYSLSPLLSSSSLSPLLSSSCCMLLPSHAPDKFNENTRNCFKRKNERKKEKRPVPNV